VRNFGNNGYNNNYNNQYAKPPYVPNKYISGNNISNDLENPMRSFISTQKELNKKFIAKFERLDALNEKVDHLTREIFTMKNNMMRSDPSSHGLESGCTTQPPRFKSPQTQIWVLI
jgi:hypothetical protein